uniref:N5-carboxyaminoimidazole ribonucleotide mutase n=1 Tax=Candidatus Methanogaster sp. ANME-2c ERB4 TaxID=2759911 RepID=A0A7G9YHI4_9EURY|nr:N5-carboxyaminoimidazole ribonucleotide mutase [Methanosarcinales archaeon ANME-2c ERB4]
MIILGSISGRDVARKASDIFDKFGIVLYYQSGIATTKPVIGVSVNAALDGMDALLSITQAIKTPSLASTPKALAQMPARILVVHVGIGRDDNAAILAARIMAVEDQELAYKLAEHRRELAEEIEPDDKRIDEQKNQDIQD